MAMLLCPSMMCADYDRLAQEVKELDAAGADIFHCDIMDGVYVPNMTMGLLDVKCVRRNTHKPIDVHLMVEHPDRILDMLLALGVDLFYLHADCGRFIGKSLIKIRQAGRKAGLVINPDQAPETLRDLFPLVDYVLVMTVYPGFAGQAYLEHITEKLKRLVALRGDQDFKIMIDGACSPARMEELRAIGADGFVLGTSALFGKPGTYEEIFQRLRRIG